MIILLRVASIHRGRLRVGLLGHRGTSHQGPICPRKVVLQRVPKFAANLQRIT